MIKLSSVEKTYGQETEIGPIDLEIPAGGMTALIGPNGAGKSTLLTIIGRLLEQDSGTVTVAGHDISAVKSKELAKELSILRQENNFVTKLTVRQLVGFGRFPYSKGRLTAEDEEIISRYIDFLGLRGLEGRYLDQLSGGQRQRAYVAMVLAQETDYVLLDEPLNNLDISHSVDMMRHLHDAAENLGRTIIVVLHDINFAARYADYICAVKDGQIVEFGPPKDVVRSDLLSSIFGTSIDVINTSRGPVAAYF
ncbi:ATP-binding cassette domain-containing protein [Corynebacterium genitalium ATCC 33030]|uniref:ABC transporter, ATP-binding protein n=1 Tax=Corynebacterium genitalium ATCC 33030 TaxID=585529 RepID=D7WF94_9CORY|nr:ATP-binding cassette domain-containing protein [Corynebacterium genitalium]MCQ4619541.1 ATP-binding cassette domain-containing protein [Corynebacterium pseudogenitalium]MCQ4620835.1 ATP-binding cassette domain-containing protein [Corynebacterium sp. CCUG 71335]MCQ4623843.1 ATP-binding cassette domain-containing protein [Corynebacterium sp. CCUG 70398]MCQ4626180.1 ATP-binding cassette domain-containing protein [Corynebacterium sp. CCUG 69979]EFK54528.1 ABC transporter, ATP-binding protein [C